MPIATLIAPKAMPVTLPQIKRHLRLDHDQDDEYLVELTQAATLHVEATIGHFLINRTVRQYIDTMPASRSIFLEAWPVKHITEARGFDVNGDINIFNTENYRLDNRMDPPALIINTNISFNAFSNGIEIDMVVGYGDTGFDVPSNITRAILVLIAHWYEFRGAFIKGNETSHIPEQLNSLLNPVKRVRL